MPCKMTRVGSWTAPGLAGAAGLGVSWTAGAAVGATVAPVGLAAAAVAAGGLVGATGAVVAAGGEEAGAHAWRSVAPQAIIAKRTKSRRFMGTPSPCECQCAMRSTTGAIDSMSELLIS